MNHTHTRDLAISILSDDIGISEESFANLKLLLIRSANLDLLEDVRVSQGRVYLSAASKFYKIPTT